MNLGGPNQFLAAERPCAHTGALSPFVPVYFSQGPGEDHCGAELTAFFHLDVIHFM